jgi:hypothetical protein
VKKSSSETTPGIAADSQRDSLGAPLPAGSLSDAGGLLTLINASQLRVDGVAYAGGDPELGCSTSFA